MSDNLDRILQIPAPEAAKLLLGSFIEREFNDGTKCTVKIVETEAYDQSDALVIVTRE
ncbi:MAG TPA: DNA-3-methyladenine glycosylase [Candidatus Saccharimonadales bacterium]|mgnify:CR=1 FL=1|nr:DNA-3-methyladenine glycosylase [Candidatus Saccharimonadales bacterium]